MHRQVTREQLEQCVRALAAADTSDEMRALAYDLLDKLLRMYDGGRLSREVLLLVSGASKRSPLERLLSGRIETQFPASLLHLHPRVTALVDAEATGRGE